MITDIREAVRIKKDFIKEFTLLATLKLTDSGYILVASTDKVPVDNYQGLSVAKDQ